ncbi:hypothetical protein [Clostridium perfringens]|uniref:hypothetical protein n=1 Tax=Clostridium perfringens TaxID=1502 RepID=UPI00232AA62C|nr:hypothetical protein [Clostridium perfringens]MDB2049610.1 hypothetical protein [Clostridium perfringens]
MKLILTKILILAGIGFLVYAGWVGLETLFTGEAIGTTTDSIVAIILMNSLYCNYMTFMNKEK